MSDNSTIENDAVGTTPQTQEYVEITDASDADLDAFLDQSQREEVEQPTQEESPTEPPQDEESDNSDKTNPEKESEPPLNSEEKNRLLEEQLKVERDRIEQQETFLKRRNSELGKIREENAQLKAALAAKIEELREDDPFSALKHQKKLDEVESQDTQIDQEQRMIAHRLVSQDVLKQHANPNFATAQEMRRTLEQDGLNPDFLSVFEQDPHVHMFPETLLQLAKRTEDRIKLSQKIEELTAKVKSLEGEKTEMKKRPDDVLRKVQEASRAGSVMKNRSGSSTPTIKEYDTTKLSDAELEALYKSFS
jgi:hypothetical protein